MTVGFPDNSVGKESTCNAGDPWSGRSPEEGNGQPTPVFLPGESHERRSLVGLQSTGLQRVRHDLGNLAHTYVYVYKISATFP